MKQGAEQEDRRRLVEAIKAGYRALDKDGKRKVLAMMRDMARKNQEESSDASMA